MFAANLRRRDSGLFFATKGRLQPLPEPKMAILEWIGAFTVTVGVIIGGFLLMLSVQNANRS